MANNKDSFAVDCPEFSNNQSDQEGKILEISSDTKFFIKYEEEMVGGYENRNLPKSTEINRNPYPNLPKSLQDWVC